MLPPDQRLFDEDLNSAEFRAGVLNGRWGLVEAAALPDGAVWPRVHLWMGAAPRPNAPERFFVALDAAGYRSVPPTGTFWDADKKASLEAAKRPKGRAESRFAKVFRTDWENGIAFYHPYDRVAAQGHPQWPMEQPRRIWTSLHTIVDWLEEFHSLLQSGDYLGV